MFTRPLFLIWMKYKILFLVFTVFVIRGMTQVQKFPDGVYLTLKQLQNQTPAFCAKLRVIKRTSGDISMNGGNDYKLESDIDSINKKYIKKVILAYVKDDSIFLNGNYSKLATWYSLCLTKGNFLAFKSYLQSDNAAMYGVLFGAIGGAIAGAVDAHKRYLCVLSLRTGNIRQLGKDYLTARLKENPDLLEEFNKERTPVSDSTMLTYIERLNKITSPTSLPNP